MKKKLSILAVSMFLMASMPLASYANLASDSDAAIGIEMGMKELESESEELESEESESPGRPGVIHVPEDGEDEEDISLLSDLSDMESAEVIVCDHTDILSHLESIQNLSTMTNILLGLQLGCMCAFIFALFWRF